MGGAEPVYAQDPGYVPLDSRARWATRALVATIVVDAVVIVSNYLEYRLLGGDFTVDEANANDLRQAIVGVLELVTLLAAVVLFIRWFWRAYKNLEGLGAIRRYKPGWAIGGWFVPILNLWRPKQIANDIWRGTDPSKPLAVNDDNAPVDSIVQWWWAAFLLANWLQNIAVRVYFAGDDSIDAVRGSDVVSIVGDALDAVAAALAIVVVRAITAREAARAAARTQLQSP
jgi:hypothetical protein